SLLAGMDEARNFRIRISHGTSRPVTEPRPPAAEVRPRMIVIRRDCHGGDQTASRDRAPAPGGVPPWHVGNDGIGPVDGPARAAGPAGAPGTAAADRAEDRGLAVDARSGVRSGPGPPGVPRGPG